MRCSLVLTSSIVLLAGLSSSGHPAHSQSGDDDGMVVEGLLGTLPQAAARQTIGARQSEMIRCVTDRRHDNDMIGGNVRVDFIVARNGSVRVARVEAGDLGDRDSERCILRIASALRFPPPTGGEANVDDTIDFPLDADVRPPIAWRPERVTAAYGTQLGRIAGRCRVSGGSVRVTAYVGRGGHVSDAGGFATSPDLDAKVDCVVSAVEDLTLADPGSYPAKVTFDVGR